MCSVLGKIKWFINFICTEREEQNITGKAQKVSQRTIYKNTDNEQIQYLLSFNSVLDVNGAINKKWYNGKEKKQRRHLPRLVWCCWKYGFHWSSLRKSNKKEKSNK